MFSDMIKIIRRAKVNWEAVIKKLLERQPENEEILRGEVMSVEGERKSEMDVIPNNHNVAVRIVKTNLMWKEDKKMNPIALMPGPGNRKPDSILIVVLKNAREEDNNIPVDMFYVDVLAFIWNPSRKWFEKLITN